MVTRRVQRLLLVGLAFLLAWQVAALAGTSRHVQVILGLHGFVFHVVFAKAYSLVPSYFARANWRSPGRRRFSSRFSSLGVVGLAGGVDAAVLLGRVAALAGSVGYANLIVGLLWQNRR